MHPFDPPSRLKRFFRALRIILPLSFIIVAALWYFVDPIIRKNATLSSPIPSFLLINENKQVHLLDFWSPVIEQISGGDGSVESLTARSVLMYDLTTNKILYQRDAKERRPMASLTKIMTAIIALENPKHDDKYYVPKEALVGEDSMGVNAGQVFSRKELLYGLMLPSGNDAAEVLAYNYPSGRDGFMKTMNDKALAMGLTNTRFSNPSGLQGDGVQYTTANDLLVMTRYAIEKFPLFREIVATPEYELPETSTHPAFTLVNETNLLTTYPGVKGVKTGYTPEAGLCLITYLDYDGHQIVGIILDSQNRRGEMKELLDYSLKALGKEPPEYNDI